LTDKYKTMLTDSVVF